MAINGFEVKPNYATPPGQTLQEVLEEKMMTQADLSERIGLTAKTISKIITGKAPITTETATKLELVLGVPATFWNNLELKYREFLEEKRKQDVLNEQIEFVKSAPYNELVKAGLVEKARDPKEKLSNMLRFFGCADVEIFKKRLQENDLLAGAYRGSDVAEVNRIALYAWIRKGEILGNEIRTKDFDKQAAKRSIPLLRELTNEIDPEIFIPELQRICSEFGVAVVLVPEVKGSRVCGLTRWLTPYPKAIIQLSLRYKSHDSLWFTFFHELGHIILHNKQPFYTFNKEYQESKEENEANEFAANVLIPEKDYLNFVNEGKYDKKSIEDFSIEIGIHPGIIVGRLQNQGLVNWNANNELKVRYEWK